ncbi:hypothetical protein TWF481_003068 [Arthrobotrys musiformis]|uniref:Uncharacterized protein n=1 Tax=Arthrobotrys musiformis TaxID=47236 RepID=A0AAV9VR60_9PEZI
MPNSDPEAMKGAWKSGEIGAKIGEVMRKIWDQVSSFEDRKLLYPKKLMEKLKEDYPDCNVVVFHNQNSEYYFINGAHSHHECKGGLFGTTFGYEAWVFECGYFRRYGDGGWENWACCGWLCSPGSEEHVLFTNGHESAAAFWDEGMANGRPHMDFIKEHCNKMTTKFESGGWWDSHEYGSLNKDRGSIPPPPKPIEIEDIDIDTPPPKPEGEDIDTDIVNHPDKDKKHPWEGKLFQLPPRTTIPLE